MTLLIVQFDVFVNFNYNQKSPGYFSTTSRDYLHKITLSDVRKYFRKNRYDSIMIAVCWPKASFPSDYEISKYVHYLINCKYYFIDL